MSLIQLSGASSAQDLPQLSLRLLNYSSPFRLFSFHFFSLPFSPLTTIGHYVFTDAELWRVPCSLGTARPKVRENPTATKETITFYLDEKMGSAEEGPSFNSLTGLISFWGSLRIWMSQVNSALSCVKCQSAHPLPQSNKANVEKSAQECW